MKKSVWMLSLFLLIPSVLADLGSTLTQAWQQILSFGSLSFLSVSPDTAVVAFTRILLTIFVFAILFGVLSGFGSRVGPLSFLSRGQAGVVAGVIAVITAIFLPASVILAVGTSWATLIALLLLGLPILGFFLLLYSLPDDSCAWRFLKLVISLLLLWIISAMRYHVGKIVVFGGYSLPVIVSIAQFIVGAMVIVFLLVLYYVWKFITCRKKSTSYEQLGEQRREGLRRLVDWIRGRGGGGNGGDDPTTPPGARRLGPAPPPSPAPKPPHPNKGDDPKPVPNPPVVDPKGKKPKVPPYKPPVVPPPPKNTRTLIDLSPWFLSVRNQDSLGACGAFAGSSIIEYIMNRVTGKLDYSHKLSELFLWYNARYDKATNVGVYAADLIHEVQKRGDCKEPLWSFEDSSSTKYLQVPPPPTYTDGLRQRVVEVRSVTLDPDDWIATLAAGNPMYIGIDTPQNFGGGVVGKSLFTDPVWPSRGGHAMVLVGYDSHFPDGKIRNEAFKVRNSWGSAWGDQGYVWFPRALLRELISRHGNVPYVFTGWEKDVPTKHKYRIIGRVVVDVPPWKPITDETGARLYHGDKTGDEDYGFGQFKVGVIAQIGGKLTILNEILVNDPSGRFVIDFEADQPSQEPLTELSRAYPQLKKVNFKKLPAGVIVYKRGAKADDKELYFHIVHFDKSKGGRGGEGMTHPENPNSAIVHSGLDFSGRPIVFLEAQPEEKNVIIPIHSDFDEDEHARKTLESIRKFGLKEKAWAEREFTFLGEMLKDVQHKDYLKARRHFLTISRAEGKVSRLQNSLENELRTHLWNLPHPYNAEFKKVGVDLIVINRSLFEATSRHEGSLRSLLNKLRDKLKLLESKRTKDDAKDALRREIDVLWTQLTGKVQKVIEWVRALVVELEKLEAAKEHKK